MYTFDLDYIEAPEALDAHEASQLLDVPEHVFTSQED